MFLKSNKNRFIPFLFKIIIIIYLCTTQNVEHTDNPPTGPGGYPKFEPIRVHLDDSSLSIFGKKHTFQTLSSKNPNQP